MVIMPAFAASPEASTPHVKTLVRADAKSGKLVRTSFRTLARLLQPATADLEKMIDRIAGKEGVEVPLVHSVIRAESNYNPAAVSPKARRASCS